MEVREILLSFQTGFSLVNAAVVRTIVESISGLEPSSVITEPRYLKLVKQGKATTAQDRSGKCLTEERQILKRWTEYCSELYKYKANGDPSVLNCPQTNLEDDHPILRREVEAAVQSLKKGKSAGVDQQNWSKQVEKM